MHGEGYSASRHQVSPWPLIVTAGDGNAVTEPPERQSQRVLHGLMLVHSLVGACTHRCHLHSSPLEASLPQNQQGFGGSHLNFSHFEASLPQNQQPQLPFIFQRGKSAPEPSSGSLFPLHPHPPDHESLPSTSLFSSFLALILLPELPAGLVEAVPKSLI